jgi:hypothetical protein
LWRDSKCAEDTVCAVLITSFKWRPAGISSVIRPGSGHWKNYVTDAGTFSLTIKGRSREQKNL